MSITKHISWQYEQAKSLVSIIKQKDSWLKIHNEQFWDLWFTNVFNLKTANEFGVSIWARILCAPLVIFLPLDGSTPFGFGENNENFWYSNFATAQAPIGLTLEEKRQVLRLLYYKQTLNNSVVSINYALKDIFGDFGVCYITEPTNMHVVYNIGFAMSSNMQTVLTNYDILPRPAGVSFELNIL